jgi:very-short-patch-repair endonuclease
MVMIKIQCSRCEKEVEKPRGEVNRSLRLGRKLYCSTSCAAIVGNTPKKSRPVLRVCPICGAEVRSSTRRRAPRFCSRSCASKGSVTETRRAAQRAAGRAASANLISTAESLKIRESWKYELLRTALESEKRDFEFEYELENFVFDLALHDKKILVEFDGRYHTGEVQLARDEEKNCAARRNGFCIIRRKVINMSVISPEVLRGL